MISSSYCRLPRFMLILKVHNRCLADLKRCPVTSNFSSRLYFKVKIEIRSMESQECVGDIWVQSAGLGTVKARVRARKESLLTRQFMPSLGINWPETLKKVAIRKPSPPLREARARKKATQVFWIGNLEARTEKGSARHQTFTSDVISCYRKRGAGEPIFALRKASLDILFSNVRFNRAALVSRPRASERTSEVQRPLGRTLLVHVFSLSEPLV